MKLKRFFSEFLLIRLDCTSVFNSYLEYIFVIGYLTDKLLRNETKRYKMVHKIY